MPGRIGDERHVRRNRSPDDEVLAAGAEALMRLGQDAVDHFDVIARFGGIDPLHPKTPASPARLPARSAPVQTTPSARGRPPAICQSVATAHP